MLKNLQGFNPANQLRYITAICCLFLLFNCTTVVLYSQRANDQMQSEKGLPFITNYSPKTYKTLTQTWSVQEDERGMMYFGVQNYVLEYDGIKWRKIPIQNNIGSSVIRSMAKDKDGLIYYGAFGDVGYLDYDSLGQKRTNSLRGVTPAANRDFYDVWTTYATESGIYFQSREYIFRLDNKKPGAKTYSLMKVWKPKTKFMYAFYLDDNYYVHQQGLGLFKMVNDSLVFIPGSELLGKERMQVMLPYKTAANEKQYLIGLFYSGLYLYDGKTFQPFSTKADPIIKSGSILYKGLQLKNGNYVLATTGKGLVIMDPQGNLLQKINRDVGLQDESIYSTYEDKKGTLWLGLDNGISQIEISSPLTKFALQSGINTGVLNIIRFEGNLYIGTSNGILAFNNTTSYFSPVPGLPLNQTFSFLPYGNELLVPEDGLFAIKNKKAFTIRESVSGDMNINTLKVPGKFPNILLGGGNFGVAVFNNRSGSHSVNGSEALNFAGYIPGITDQIWSLADNKDGTVWAGTQAGLAYRIKLEVDEKGNIDLQKTSFEKFGAEHGLKNGLGQVYSIKGINYFVADSSLYTFDDKLKRFIPDTTFGYFKKGGGTTEFDMVEDDKERVWIRFGKELRIAYPKPEGGYRFDNTLLSSINELTIQKIFIEKNGIVWICTTDGLIRYDENIEKNRDQSFKTILRSASAGKNGLTTIINTGAKPVAVPYTDNSLRFEYAAPYFEQEEKTQYQTFLEGFEKDWSDFDNNYYKEYTNLPPGDYHFHVRAKNIYQQLSEEAVYAFSINPPWYKTWWAYLLYAFTALSILYIIIKWRTHQLHEKHRELEKIVAERTGQLSQRVEELAVINSVQEGLVREMDMQGIYELVGEKIREIFNAQVMDIVTYDKANNLLEDKYVYEKGDRTLMPPRKPVGFGKHVIDTRQVILINENLAKKSVEFNSITIQGEPAKSAVWVPLITGNEVKGIISLQDLDKEHAFTDADVNLLTTLANSMSMALESARRFHETTRLLKETEQRTAELAVINSVQEGLAKELDIQAIYDLVGDKLAEVMNTLDIDIRLFSPETNQVFYPYVRDRGMLIQVPPSPIKGMSKYILETGQNLIINEKLAERMTEMGSTLVPGTQMEKSFMAVPIMAGNTPMGMVSVSNYEQENAFSNSDVRLLQTVVSAMTVALKNAKLFDETNRLLKETEMRQEELATINSVQEGLVKEFKSEAIYELVGSKLCELFDTESVLIRTFDHAAGKEIWQYAIEKGERQYTDPRPFNWANKQLIKNHQPIFINENYVETAKQFGGSGVSMGKPPKSAVFVPMIVGDVVRGSVSLQNLDKENAFSEADVKLLTTITNSMGVALENARLFDETTRLLDETKQRAAELSTVNSISKLLASQLDADDLIKMVGDELKDLFKANIVYMALLNPKTKIIHFPYQSGDEMKPIKLGEGLTSKIISNGQPLLINKDLQELRAQMGIQKIGIPAASYLGVPIPVGDENIGVLSVQSTEQENRFNENDLRLLSTIASSVGVALRNATLFEEVKQAKQEAEAASKIAEKANEAKSAFLSTVSHELRTPLTSVLGFAKIIKKRLEEKIFPIVDRSDVKTAKTISQVSENLHVVISEGERLTHLINDVLDLAKIEAGKMDWNQENVSLAEVAERAIAATTSLFDQKSLQLIRQIEPDLPEIVGDRDKLIQVVINLISNSVKFTDKGSITCRLQKMGDEIIVSIIDTGIGIKAEDFGAVFEQFKQVGGDTLTDKPKGTGLGLPICKEIVEHLGGRIWLESEVGKGSTFSFALPFIKWEAGKDKPIHLNELVKQLKQQMVFSKLKIEGKNSTILIVDDDDSIRSLLRQELSEAGYLTEEAANGKEALECIRKNKPDLVILDVMMPEINGFDVAAILKNDPQTMDIPIIVLSIVQDKARGFRIGVDRYLTKPIDTTQLFAEVGTLLEQGKSKKKVMVVDEDSVAVRTLTDVLQAKGYHVVESDGKELVANAIANQPDIIILNSILTDKSEIVQTLRFEKGLENVLFFIYQ